MGLPQVQDSRQGYSDIAQDWEEALIEFKKVTGKNLDFGNITNVEEAVRQAEVQQRQFNNFRHDKGQVDKVRSAFSNNIGLIQRVWNGATSIATAAGAFPPAMPVAPLMMAFTYVFQTFRNISADYDRVLGFFDEMRAFLDRISMLQGHKPKLEPFGRCLREVFTSMFKICAIAADTKHEKRFKKWLSALKDGAQDPDLAIAYNNMETAIQRLSEATGIATYQAVSVVDGKVTRLESDMRASLEISERIEAFTIESFSVVRESLEDVSIKIDGYNRTVTAANGTVISEMTQMKEALNKMLQQSESTNDKSNTAQTGRSKHQRASNEKGDASAKKPKALAAVKRHFADGAVVRKLIEAQREDISESFVEGTATWIVEDERLQPWLKGDQYVAWLSGSAGLGKTFLAYAIVAHLHKLYDEHTRISVAHFYFREEDDTLRSFRDALRCIAVQIAEQDATYCEQVAADISSNVSEESPWEQFFASRYPQNSDARLYLVLDGVDETREDDKPLMLSLFRQIAEAELNIHVLLIGRGDLDPRLPDEAGATIEVTRAQIAEDMQKLVEARTQPKSPFSLARLAKFRRHTRNRIRDKVMQSADGMLYVEQMLRRLNSIGREGAVLRDLEKNTPANMTGLYELMLAECQRGRAHSQYLALKALFAMCAYSKRALTLDEARHLINLTDTNQTFDVEEEIIGRSARILDIPRSREEDDEDVEVPADGHDEHLDGQLSPETDNTGRTTVTFQDRSLRDYFRAISVEENGLRTPPSLAHYTIFDLLVKVLCSDDPHQKDSLDQQHLQDYAARFWAYHFVSISTSDLPDERVTAVLSGLSGILGNKSNTSAIFEKYGVHFYGSLDKEVGLIAHLSAFITRARATDFALLDQATKSWVENIDTQPSKAMLPLARGHINNWHEALRKDDALISWRGAKEALLLAGADIPNENTKEAVLAVSRYFGDMEMTADVLRTIGSALLGLSCNNEAFEYCLESLEKSGARSRNAFYAQWILADAKDDIARSMRNDALPQDDEEPSSNDPAAVQANSQEYDSTQETDRANSADQYDDEQNAVTSDKTSKMPPWELKVEEVIQHIESALAALPEGWSNKHELLEDLEGVVLILMERASCETRLRRNKDAVATYNECRALQQLSGTDLDDMIRARDWSDHPDDFVELLKSWTTAERLAWVGYLVDEEDENSSEAFNVYVKLAGSEHHDLVVQFYEEYIKTLRTDSAKRVVALNYLAKFFSIVTGNNQKALDLYSSVLNLDIKRDEFYNLDEWLLTTRLNKSALLFEEFRASTSPKRKVESLKEMERLPEIHIGKGPNTSFEESQSAIMLAIMTRSCGRAVDCQEILQRCFQRCQDGLTDSVGWNDSGSLRLLARVLACVPGLERDAQIALSCQFSITDPGVEHSDDASSTGYISSETDETSTDCESNERNNADTVIYAVEAKTTDGTLYNQAADNDKDDGGTLTFTESRTTDGATEQHTVATRCNTVLLGLENSRIGDSEDASPKGLKEEGKAAISNVDPALDDGEDLLPQSQCKVSCDGNCDTHIQNWQSQPMYLCIHCPNTDLCESCLQKRRAMDKGEPCSFWRPWCGQEHRHIKGPIEGWKGIKSGVIRIGEERLPFKEWLDTLEKDRWEKAWQDFWRNESFLSDIGV